ncbi:hypothetical protein MATR_20250 [Marivirga tractuosa]|uniref:DUF1990 domain-containing protein n=1 Tax=Marivirga tractuosa (strain ATCC 23168 / DSM 4126 / NBRC 15989 / NCIMB 1408 / VKM B-1430 / H-43) TaxID=643867 RepID=E4TMQ9_MARTH|nr:hypothetical protein [Marivirga tractuosa]ADR20357.1 hypothetical protein Ftrac_0349 [Marivirga tractuosa DSM 4126]BDD15200.1 hypothetical protein MATR_20250 [Marivirga tractuosa]
METQQALQIKPPNFKTHIFTKEYESPYQESQIWDWLNDPKTFVDNQTWPFRVEFLLNDKQQHEFETGVLTTHHGPLLSLAGQVGEITPHYRDLLYYYGSYVFSFRIVRPFRLEFWTEDNGEKRIVKMQLSSFVAPSFYSIWNWGQNIFWGRFGRWMNRNIKKRIK